ncbi:MAG TPA: PIG-L deacetylase family protein [Acidimicrobiales bacterium]|nr:PIG-L deacetylase family protein [Acidimicrobiales bacterium]
MDNEPQVERVLVVTAHPDDVDFGAAGSIATWVSQGIEVSYCIVTNGDAGGFDPEVPRADIAGIRQAEQRAAAAAVGVTDVTFLGYPDGALYVTHELRRDISREIRRVRPQRVVSQSPERNFERIYASHPDHLAAGEATIRAVYPDARNPYAHLSLAEEGFDAWTVGEVWIMGGGAGASTFVDITEAIDKKVDALRCHVSQVEHFEDLDGFLRQWAAGSAKSAGWEEGRLAEGFRVVNTA